MVRSNPQFGTRRRWDKKQRPSRCFLLGDRMAAALALVIVVMVVGVGAVVIVVVMSVPVIVPMAITLVLGIVTVLIPPSRHKHLEVLGAMGMVVILAEGPVIQQRVSGE
ncbi:MAG: hypothetical protein CM15mP74_29450 [Halieaceae bacterium]|nr:MAG: hypothetical protein CM15mP74_29450 [Halieaceae bacterium]